METSYFLAQVMGPIFVIGGIGLTMNPKYTKKIVTDFMKSPGLIWLASFFMLIVGMLLVLSHNVWDKDWTVLVTIIGWLVLLKGVFFMLAPSSMMSMGKDIMKGKNVFLLGGLAWLLMGVYLSYFGYLF